MKAHDTIYHCKLRCGLLASFVVLEQHAGIWALQGCDGEGAIHLWRLDGKWTDEGEPHPYDIIDKPIPQLLVS